MGVISLIGYMGGGKSLIANILAGKLGWEKIDLDSEISEKTQMSVPEIFEKKGEIFFRKLEKETLEELLTTENQAVLSLGGGTPCYYNNIDLINEKSISVYLRAKVDTLVKRLIPEKEGRPLLAKLEEDKIADFVGAQLFGRNHFYNQAKIIVDTDDLSPEEVADKILKRL